MPAEPTEQPSEEIEAQVPQPDLTNLPFRVLLDGGPCVISTVEMDSGSDADDQQVNVQVDACVMTKVRPIRFLTRPLVVPVTRIPCFL